MIRLLMAATIFSILMAPMPASAQHTADIFRGHPDESSDITSKSHPHKPTPQLTPAVFPGGEEALANFMASAFEYPEEAIVNGVTGTVVISFNIAADGTLSNPQIVRSILPSVDDAALKVLDRMPRWQPALLDGKPIEATGQLPIVLTLQ